MMLTPVSTAGAWQSRTHHPFLQESAFCWGKTLLARLEEASFFLPEGHLGFPIQVSLHQIPLSLPVPELELCLCPLSME